MKKSSKKGFTLVELVIVIAVIAILAAVLIPTFAGVQENAKQSAALQACRNELVEVKSVYGTYGKDVPEGLTFVSDKYAYKYVDGNLQKCDFDSNKTLVELQNVSVYSDVKVQKATQSDAKCNFCGKIHAISITLPNGVYYGTTENSNSYEIRNSENQIVASEQFNVSSDKRTVYFNISTCTNDGSPQYDNLTSYAKVGAGYYTYKVVVNGTTYTGIFYFAE